MNDSKKPWMSRGFWGAVAVIVVAGANQFGYEVDAKTFEDTMFNAVSAGAGVVALIGRVLATKKIET